MSATRVKPHHSISIGRRSNDRLDHCVLMTEIRCWDPPTFQTSFASYDGNVLLPRIPSADRAMTNLLWVERNRLVLSAVIMNTVVTWAHKLLSCNYGEMGACICHLICKYLQLHDVTCMQIPEHAQPIDCHTLSENGDAEWENVRKLTFNYGIVFLTVTFGY